MFKLFLRGRKGVEVEDGDRGTQIVAEGTGEQFSPEVNQHWTGCGDRLLRGHPDLEDSIMDHDTIIEDWRRNAELHDDENYEFLRSLKLRDYGFDPDELAAELHERAFQAVDCTHCANCCKTLETMITNADAQRIAEHLNMTPAAFAEAYLATFENGDRKFRQQPCPFLGEDDRCRIYRVRPTDCREYPFTNKEGLVFRTMGHANRALTCPAVFWIVEQMRSRSLGRQGRRGRIRRK